MRNVERDQTAVYSLLTITPDMKTYMRQLKFDQNVSKSGNVMEIAKKGPRHSDHFVPYHILFHFSTHFSKILAIKIANKNGH